LAKYSKNPLKNSPQKVPGIPDPSKKVLKIPIKLMSALTEKREKAREEIREDKRLVLDKI